MNKYTIKRWAQHLVNEQRIWEARQRDRLKNAPTQVIVECPAIFATTVTTPLQPKEVEKTIIVYDGIFIDVNRPKTDKEKWKAYKRLVWKITNQQPVKRLKHSEKRGFHNYHLDHKVSIWYGYKNSVDPHVIGSIKNLEFIPWKDNFKKAIKCNFNGNQSLQTTLFI